MLSHGPQGYRVNTVTSNLKQLHMLVDSCDYPFIDEAQNALLDPGRTAQ
jgi:hypothetical protein